MSGFLMLSRKVFKNKYWNESRTFSAFEAWLDLIQMARFDEASSEIMLPNRRVIKIERGEIHASLRFLAQRWGWGVMQVRVFLKKEVESGSITQRITQGENIITLCNYSKYNRQKKPNNTPNNTPITHRQHTDNTNNNKENKDNKENKGEDAPAIFQKIDFDEESLQRLNETIADWNTIPHAKPYKDLIITEGIRLDFAKRLHEVGESGIREAVEGIRNSEFWKRATTPLTLRQFLQEEKFHKARDGIYAKVYQGGTGDSKPLNAAAEANRKYEESLERCAENQKQVTPEEQEEIDYCSTHTLAEYRIWRTERKKRKEEQENANKT